jgi:GNAT superfamily N-acetyltransferase
MVIKELGPEDEALLADAVPGVFDREVDLARAREFLADPRHHIVVALDSGRVIGFASGVDHVHPDKPAELWINEVGVAPGERRRGVGRQVVGRLLEVARGLGCVEAWVLTEEANRAAIGLYASIDGVRAAPDPRMFTIRLRGEETS